ncbi:tetratricopeptide repeat protein [Arhodomonas sp. AD133]|uniref:tetratricopeptide repeat protein n=1 Tax=Arhodomonas sp. AD133 TaxID=3415009 RepID=UPI003EB7625E
MIKHSAATGRGRTMNMTLLAAMAMLIGGCAGLPLQMSDAAAVKARANGAYQSERWGAAARDYRRYVESVPSDPHAWYRLGNAEARLGELRAAEAAYYAALEADPELARARHNLGLVQIRLAWRALAGARRDLPADDRAGRETRRLLTCLRELFMAGPDAEGECPAPDPTEGAL